MASSSPMMFQWTCVTSMTAQVANLVETTERLGRSTPAASLRYQGRVAAALSKSPKRFQHKQIGRIDSLGDAAAIGWDCRHFRLVGLANAAHVHGGNPVSWLSQYQPTRGAFAQPTANLDMPQPRFGLCAGYRNTALSLFQVAALYWRRGDLKEKSKEQVCTSAVRAIGAPARA